VGDAETMSLAAAANVFRYDEVVVSGDEEGEPIFVPFVVLADALKAAVVERLIVIGDEVRCRQFVV